MAIEVVDLPIKTGDFSIVMLVYQRVAMDKHQQKNTVNQRTEWAIAAKAMWVYWRALRKVKLKVSPPGCYNY